VAGVLEAVYWRYPASLLWDWVTTAALVAMVGGLGLRTWAVFTLKSYFTWHISVQPDQRVMREGPYRLVRHPSYTAALLTYLGGPVFLHAWVAAALACIVLLVAFRRRILLEEALLVRELGPEYERYRHDLKALIPGVW
jgi:protein-S-isoprenylcysteine O-methyltransferase